MTRNLKKDIVINFVAIVLWLFAKWFSYYRGFNNGGNRSIEILVVAFLVGIFFVVIITWNIVRMCRCPFSPCRVAILIIIALVFFTLPSMESRFLDGYCEYLKSKDLKALNALADDINERYLQGKLPNPYGEIPCDQIPEGVLKIWNPPPPYLSFDHMLNMEFESLKPIYLQIRFGGLKIIVDNNYPEAWTWKSRYPHRAVEGMLEINPGIFIGFR
jgi:hypothetical protein